MSTHALWWITLGAGLVVAVVAIVLLQTFLNQVKRIERGAEGIWEAAKPVARNTATTWMLTQTTVRLDRLTEEALRHDALLASVQGDSAASNTDGDA